DLALLAFDAQYGRGTHPLGAVLRRNPFLLLHHVLRGNAGADWGTNTALRLYLYRLRTRRCRASGLCFYPLDRKLHSNVCNCRTLNTSSLPQGNDTIGRKTKWT